MKTPFSYFTTIQMAERCRINKRRVTILFS